jgi:hypothetical protein
MLEQKRGNKPRPYWHVDAKWMTGISLMVTVSLWLFMMALYQVTAQDLTTTLSKDLISSLSLPSSSTSQQITDAINEQLAKDSATSSVKISAPIELNQYSNNISAQVYQAATVVGSVGESIHGVLLIMLVIVGVVILALTAQAVYFSYRFGRLVTPGVILMMASIPGLLILSLAVFLAEQISTNASMASSGALLAATARSAQMIYLIAFIVAICLLLAALVGRVVAAARKPKQTSQNEQIVAVPPVAPSVQAPSESSDDQNGNTGV